MTSLTTLMVSRSPRRLPRLGLLGRISLTLLAVGLLPLAAASYRLMGMNRDSMTEQVLRTHAVAAQTTAGRVEAFLGARRVVAQMVAVQETLAVDPRASASTDLLSELLRSSLGFGAVSVRDLRGEEVIRVQHPGVGDAMEEVLALPMGEELAVARVRGAWWLRIDLPLGPPRPSPSAAPDAAPATALGRLQVVCDLAPLEGQLRPRELGEHADLVMVDGRGEPVSGQGEVLARFPQEMVALALSGRVSGSGRFETEQDAVLGAYAPVAGAPWIVLSRQSAQVAEVTARTMQRRSLMAVALAVALVVAMTGVARQSIVGPIQALVRSQRRLVGAAGQPPAEGGEIEELKATFAVLERRIQDQEALGEVFLGRYRVVSVVGEGAMGTVFRGWDPALKRSVAIKTVRFDRRQESERVELAARLLEEAVTVARFSHPNIVGLYDIQESPEVTFLAMEYVDGTSLEGYLEARGRLPAEEAVPIALAIARALSVAHARGVVHHDIKPANVLLGRDGAVKVVDFGISQIITSLLEKPNLLFGTPGYMPPEALKGGGYGPPGDLFALGVTLYLMLTGEMLFAGDSVQEMLRRTLLTTATPPGTRVPGISQELDSLVMSLLEKDPTLRCPSAEEAIKRLEPLASSSGSPWQPSFLTEPDLELKRTEKLSRSQLISPSEGSAPDTVVH